MATEIDPGEVVPERPPRFPRGDWRIRWRVALVGALIAAVGGSGWLLDQELGPRAAASGSPEGLTTGAWFCPHGGGPGLRAWVVITNPGLERASIRMTTLTSLGEEAVRSFSLGPGRQTFREVRGDDASAATEVEYFGGQVGASALLQSGTPGGGVAAEACVAGPQREWFLPDERTTEGENAYLVVMNPFAESASFDIELLTEGRIVRPAALTPFALGPRSSTAIHVNDHALLFEAEATISARVILRIGRVIVGSTIVTDGGIRAEAGVSLSSDQWIFPAAGYAEPMEVVVMDTGEATTEMTVASQSANAQRLVSGPEGLSVAGGGVGTFQIDGLPDAGAVVQSSNQTPFVSLLRLSGPNGDVANLTGASSSASVWLVMPSVPPSGGTQFVVLENPGRVDALVSFTVIGARGGAALAAVTVPAGRTVTIALAPTVGKRAVSVLVRASEGTIVAASVSYSSGGKGYAATLALPMKNLG